jgi:hypothetical protein
MPSYPHHTLFSVAFAPDKRIIIAPLNLNFMQNPIQESDFTKPAIWVMCFKKDLIFIGLTNEGKDVRIQWKKYLETFSFRGVNVGFNNQTIIYAQNIDLIPIELNINIKNALLGRPSQTTEKKLDFSKINSSTFGGPIPESYRAWDFTFHLFFQANDYSKSLLEIKNDLMEEVKIRKLKKCEEIIDIIQNEYNFCLTY